MSVRFWTGIRIFGRMAAGGFTRIVFTVHDLGRFSVWQEECLIVVSLCTTA
jgi:hypothetical protein